MALNHCHRSLAVVGLARHRGSPVLLAEAIGAVRDDARQSG